MRIAAIAVVLGAMIGAASMAVDAGESARRQTNIPAQELAPALRALAKTLDFQIVYASQAVSTLRTQGAVGDFTPNEALKTLLNGTGLTFRYLDANTVTIMSVGVDKEAQSFRVAETGDLRVALQRANPSARTAAVVAAADEGSGKLAAASTQQDVQNSKGIPEILVRDRRTSNVDIRRTEDDVQPYVVIDAEDIKRAPARNIEDLLRSRLPMNQSYVSKSQDVGNADTAASTIDLRGLGPNQTLILVNGRRMPRVPEIGQFSQADINGIPLSAVERIEILPSTAGGIYGGGATGGVVNIILKRDYNGVDVKAGYDGTFAGGGSQRRLEASGGFALWGGRTEVMLTGSYHDGQPMTYGDRAAIFSRSVALVRENAPDTFLNSFSMPYGYTTNILSRSGNDLVLVDGDQSLGFSHASVPVGYGGPGGDNGAAFLGTAGQFNFDQPNDFRGRKQAVLSTPESRSASININQHVTDRINLFLDASRYDNGSVNFVTSIGTYTLNPGPASPFTEAVSVQVPLVGFDPSLGQWYSKVLTEQLGGGAIIQLSRGWTAQAEYRVDRSQNRSQSSFLPAVLPTNAITSGINDGTLQVLRDVNLYPLDFSPLYNDVPGGFGNVNDRNSATSNATLRLAGPVWTLAGGPVMLSTLMERRKEDTEDTVQTQYNTFTGVQRFIFRPSVGNTTRSAYAEITAPLVSSSNARAGLQGLDLQLSYRYDTIETRTHDLYASVDVPSADGPFPDLPPSVIKDNSANQYTLGFRYKPVEDLTFRFSYAEGVLPPAINQIAPYVQEPAYLIYYDFIDPKRGDTLIESADEWVDSGLTLRPEQSSSFEAGIIFTPRALPGLRLSVDYTRIRKTGEILEDPGQTVIDAEDALPGRIVRGPLSAADQVAGYTGGPIISLNLGAVNLAHSLVEVFDVSADYTWETAYGDFRANLLGAYQPHLTRQVTADSSPYDLVGYDAGPLKMRYNGGLTWERGGWAAGWNMQYYDSYKAYSVASELGGYAYIYLDQQGASMIPSQMYHDVFASYRFEQPGSAWLSGWLAGTELQIGVQNVLNALPPVIASSGFASGRLGYSTHGDARLRRYSLSFSKRF